MISRLPRWVWFAAWVLAFVAGMVNVVGLLGFEHQAVTHLTGTTSMVAAALAAREVDPALWLAAVIGSFVAGCVVSGFLTRDDALVLGQRHAAVFLLEALCLAAAVPLLQRGLAWGVLSASFACGLQNALTSTYSGALVRTTHLTGMFTDLGIFLGHRLRGLPADARRLHLCTVVTTGFLFGGIAGGFAFLRLGYPTLLMPGALAAGAGLLCAVRRTRRADRSGARKH